jgi:tetratricopeptide (TPR) repeat protein
MAHNNIGVSQSDAGDHSGAIESYRRAIAIRARLAADHPNVPKYREALVVCHKNLGLQRSASGDRDGAIESHREAIAIADRLVQAFPDFLDGRSVLGLARHELAESLYDARRFRDAERAYRQAADSQRVAFDRAPRMASYRALLDSHLRGVAKSLLALGEGEEAARGARERLRLMERTPPELYQGACELAMCLAAVPEGGRKQELAAETVRVLEEAVAAGWNDAARTGRDPELAPVRNRDDFRRLLVDLFDRGFPVDPLAR